MTAARRLAVHPDWQVAASAVGNFEIGLGPQGKDSAKPDKAYADLPQVVKIVPLEPSVTPPYASIRNHLAQRGQPIRPNDTCIAAHALRLMRHESPQTSHSCVYPDFGLRTGLALRQQRITGAVDIRHKIGHIPALNGHFKLSKVK